MLPALNFFPNAVSGVAIDKKAHAAVSWNVDVYCTGTLGKKAGQLNLQAGAEVTAIFGNTVDSALKLYADSNVKNIAGTPIYAGARVGHTDLTIGSSESRKVTDVNAYIGISR